MITKVQMINCQSIKNCMFDLATDKLNVIIADNGTGKSVLFKMLKIATNPNYYSRAERKDLIRRHTECALLYLLMDDGSLSCTAVYPTYTLYSYQRAGETTVQQSYEPDPEMLQKAGLLIDDSGEPFVANIVDSDQDLLLVNSKQKYNSNLIKMLVEHPVLEGMREKTHENIVRIGNPLSSLTTRCSALEKAINESSYFDVAMRELELQTVSSGKELMYDAINIYEYLSSLENILIDTTDYEFIDKAITLIELMESLDLNQLVPSKKPINIAKEIDLLETTESIDLQALSIDSEPIDVSKELALLEQLETLKLSPLQVGKKPRELDKALDLLEKIEKLDISKLYLEPEPPDLEEAFMILKSAFEISNALTLCQSLLLTVQDIEKNLHEVEAELLRSGRMVECAIHGKVIYNGKECIPYSI